jgi:DNA-directed RNA polymerase subunit RPC12/RpoP
MYYSKIDSFETGIDMIYECQDCGHRVTADKSGGQETYCVYCENHMRNISVPRD